MAVPILEILMSWYLPFLFVFFSQKFRQSFAKYVRQISYLFEKERGLQIVINPFYGKFYWVSQYIMQKIVGTLSNFLNYSARQIYQHPLY